MRDPYYVTTFENVPEGVTFSHVWDGYVNRGGYAGYLYKPEREYALAASGRVVSLEPAGFRVWNPEDCGFKPDTRVRVCNQPHGLNLDGYA